MTLSPMDIPAERKIWTRRRNDTSSVEPIALARNVHVRDDAFATGTIIRGWEGSTGREAEAPLRVPQRR